MEGGEARRRVRRAHKLETNKWQSARPAGLVAFDVVTQHLYNSSVGAFGAAVRFRMEGGRHLEVDTGETMQRLPEGAHKEFVTVGYNVDGEAVFAIPVNEEEFRELFGRHVVTAGEDTELGTQTTSDGADAVETVVFGEAANEIDSDTLEAAIGDGERMKRAPGFLGGGFVTLTGLAAGDVEAFEVTAHVRPVIRRAEERVGLVGAKMAHRVMAETVESFAEFGESGNAEPVANKEEPVTDGDTGEG